MEGYGVLFYASGKPYYCGQWKQGNFEGRGSFFNEQEDKIEGGFDYKDFSNIGRRWTSFEGTFKQDKKCGQGVLTLSNG